jgi:glucokinase
MNDLHSTNTPPVAIGVDIGGTKIALAAVDRDGVLLNTHTLATDAAAGTAAVFDRLADTLSNLIASLDRPAVGLGIAAPGPVDGEQAIALNAVNLGWRDVHLRRELSARGIALPVFAANDVNAGAVGEGVFGAARGLRDYVYLAVGTGLGGGAVSSGRLVVGARGSAMEVGHMALSPWGARAGRPCPCGLRGCAETVLSGVGLAAAMRERLGIPAGHASARVTASAILAADSAGDDDAAAVLDEAADALGMVMAWTAAVFDPHTIVIGGGLGEAAYPRLIGRATALFRRAALGAITDTVQIVRGAAVSPALGAAALVWNAQSAL